jgi:peptidyl-prolyl cis-trans isomerase B (cyclophilin B)
MRHLILAFFLLTPQISLAADPPFILPSSNELARIRSAVFETSAGEFFVELYPEDAPWHVANLKYLCDHGYYKNNRIHLVHENYIVQFGAPTRTQERLVAYSIPPEFSKLKHEEGAFGMGRAPDEINPQRRSSSSQLHVLLSENPRMDGAYTIFGRVVAGISTVRKLREGELIKDCKVYLKPS